jgi:hypothetical protein
VSQRPPSRRGFVELLEVTAAHCLRSVSYPRLCTKSRRRPATLGFSLRSSAYLCDLCVKRALQTQRSQRYAEGRREIIRLFVQSPYPRVCSHARSPSYEMETLVGSRCFPAFNHPPDNVGNLCPSTKDPAYFYTYTHKPRRFADESQRD